MRTSAECTVRVVRGNLCSRPPQSYFRILPVSRVMSSMPFHRMGTLEIGAGPSRPPKPANRAREPPPLCRRGLRHLPHRHSAAAGCWAPLPPPPPSISTGLRGGARCCSSPPPAPAAPAGLSLRTHPAMASFPARALWLNRAGKGSRHASSSPAATSTCAARTRRREAHRL